MLEGSGRQIPPTSQALCGPMAIADKPSSICLKSQVKGMQRTLGFQFVCCEHHSHRLRLGRSLEPSTFSSLLIG